MAEENNVIEKSEIVEPLLKRFKQINDISENVLNAVKKEKYLDLETSEIIKNNVLAMCEITNTLNSVFGVY